MRRRGIEVLAAIGALALLLAAVGALCLGYMVHRGFSAKDEPTWPEILIARTLRHWSAPAAIREAKSPVVPTAEVYARSRAHWADHCASCHANDGSGDTVLGRSMYPRAPDMRKAATQGLTDGELFAVIQEGIRLTGMPAWGAAGDDMAGSWELVAFIRHLPSLTAEEQQEMKKLNPRSPDEVKQEREEEEFLNGSDSPSSDAAPTQH